MSLLIRKAIKNIDSIISCGALVVVILSVSYGVFMRYVFGDPPVWTNELAAIAFTWLVFIGASVAYKKKMHIGIDLLVNHVPVRIKWGIEFLAHLILFVFMGYMVVYGLVFSIESYAQPTSILRIPNTFFYMAVPVSFALMLVNQFSNFVGHCRKASS